MEPRAHRMRQRIARLDLRTRLLTKRPAQRPVLNQAREQRRQGPVIVDRYEIVPWRQVGQDADSRADRGPPAGRRLQRDHTARLVARGQHAQIGIPVVVGQAFVRDAPVKGHVVRERERPRQPLQVRAQRAVADDVQFGPRRALHDFAHGAQQHGLVLDRDERGHVQQLEPVAGQRARRAGGEQRGIDAQRRDDQAVWRDARCGQVVQERRAGRHPVRVAQAEPHHRARGAAELVAVADVRQRDEFAAPQGHDGGGAQQPAGGHGDQPRLVRPYPVQRVKAAAARLGHDRAHGPHDQRNPSQAAGGRPAQGMDRRAIDRVSALLVWVAQRKDMDLVFARQRADKVQEHRNAPVRLARAEARQDQSELHRPTRKSV
ncbi:MAG: hypothetical protein Kow00120_02960 [Anaerolineae bacterium]